jgi:hypothetical protein
MTGPASVKAGPALNLAGARRCTGCGCIIGATGATDCGPCRAEARKATNAR